jgi:hypothetical protein
MKPTNKAFWWRELKFFVKPHPELHPGAGEIYIPRDRLKIAFYADAIPKIVGNARTLQINFNDRDFVVLAIESRSVSRVYRILWQRLVGFELISGPDIEMPPELNKRFFLN